LAAEVTLQPLRRYKEWLGAVVIFSDILIIPPAMGLEVVMEQGKGPTFPRTLNHPDDLNTLTLRPDASTAYTYLYEAIALTRKLAKDIKPVPVIGFAGGPWTLMSYMIEGGSGSKDGVKAKKWLFEVSVHACLPVKPCYTSVPIVLCTVIGIPDNMNAF
jgi:uroporphyrinogen decarboxylase